MKVLEHVVEMQIRKSIKIDDIQFVFMPGCGTTDTIFSERQLQKKFLEKKIVISVCWSGKGKRLLTRFLAKSFAAYEEAWN